MQLANFSTQETIFIDANIFAYFAVNNPTFEKSCANFLARILTDEINAVTSAFALNEAFYAILSALLQQPSTPQKLASFESN